MEEHNNKKRKDRIKGDYTPKYFIAYAFNRIKKEHPELSYGDIHRAITTYFELAKNDLALGQKISLLNKLGNLYLTKEQRGVEYDEKTGTIKNTLPVNIAETLKLWKNKPELKHKTYVRFTNDHSDNYFFKLHFETSKAMFKNKSIYDFQFNKSLKKELNINIIDKKVDAYIINRKTYE